MNQSQSSKQRNVAKTEISMARQLHSFGGHSLTPGETMRCGSLTPVLDLLIAPSTLLFEEVLGHFQGGGVGISGFLDQALHETSRPKLR